MADPVRWGVLGAADIGFRKVLPAMRGSEISRTVAIGSRSLEKARMVADSLGIDRAYGSYKEVLADPDVEAVYIPLPNHLHKEWTLAAITAGKHVLCEKPLALSSADGQAMVDAAREAGVKLMEAFMYRLHPLWSEVRRVVDEGLIGEVLAIHSFFSYRNLDAGNIRNIAEYGGGALYDVGCYPVNVARMIFASEPVVVKGLTRADAAFGTDALTTALLDFGGRHAVFTCSTQLEDLQRVDIVGTAGRLVVEIPYNIPPDRPTRLLRYAGGEPPVAPDLTIIEVPTADQYGIQADEFSHAVRTGQEVPTPPSDAVANLEVIERIFADAGHEISR